MDGKKSQNIKLPILYVLLHVYVVYEYEIISFLKGPSFLTKRTPSPSPLGLWISQEIRVSINQPIKNSTV